MDIKTLDLKARQVAKDYRKLENQLLELIIQIDQNKIFYKLGFSSLFQYLTEALELSPAMASAFTNVARKSQEVPELKNEVISGKLSIYKAQRITSVLTKQNSKTWLTLAEHKTHRELEREVAMASPKNAIYEKVIYISPHKPSQEKITIKQDICRMELKLGVSEQLMLKIRRAQDLESQKKKKNLNLEETLDEVFSFYLEKRDPLKKAQRLKAKGKLQKSPANQIQEKVKSQSQDYAQVQDIVGNGNRKMTGQTKLPSKECCTGDKNCARAITPTNKRENIPAFLRHQVQLRDRSRCAHRDPNGKLCGSQRYLEIHHIQPVSRGGNNSIENLVLLCSGHHKSVHSQKGELHWQKF